MARPKTEIDWQKVDRMLEADCTGTEVAASLGIHPNTLYRLCEEQHKISFSAYSAEKRASGDRLLKMKQFEIAMSGDRSMLIWLGKQRLNQSDKKTNDITTGGKPFTGFNFLPGDDVDDEENE